MIMRNNKKRVLHQVPRFTYLSKSLYFIVSRISEVMKETLSQTIQKRQFIENKQQSHTVTFRILI